MIPQAHLKESAKPLARTEKLVVQHLDDEVLIYDLENNKAFNLNQTSALVWQNCDGNRSVRDIAISLEKELNHHIPDELVLIALDSLKRERLVEMSNHSILNPTNFNRRQAIRKVGIATLVAIPVVGALVAPQAASAASLNCRVCSKKTAAECAVCDGLGITGRCQLNSGCGQGQNAGQTTCTACFIQNGSNPGGVSWGGP